MLLLLSLWLLLLMMADFVIVAMRLVLVVENDEQREDSTGRDFSVNFPTILKNRCPVYCCCWVFRGVPQTCTRELCQIGCRDRHESEEC